MKDFKGDKMSGLFPWKRFNPITDSWEEGTTTESLINYFIKHDILPNHDYLINENETTFDIDETPDNIDMDNIISDEDNGFSLIETHEHSSEHLFYFNKAKKVWTVFDQLNGLKYDLDTEGVIAFIDTL